MGNTTLRAILQEATRARMALFLCFLTPVALLFSKFLLTVCMVFLLAMALFAVDSSGRFPVRLNPALGQNWRNFLADKGFLSLTLIFFIVLLSGLYSDDTAYLLERLRIRLPFLVLPFAFVSLPPLTERQYHAWFYWLLVLMALTTAGVCFNYWIHYDTISARIGQGQPVPVPMNHIRFSLMMAFSIMAGLLLFARGFVLRYPWERYLTGGLSLLLLLAIHLLAVRSGLAVLYLSLALLALRWVVRTRRIAAGLSALALIVAMPVAAYYLVPAFRTKLAYTVWDYQMYRQGTGQNYSDSERLVSIEVGLKIGAQNPLLGVGAGDLMREVKRIYAAEYPQFGWAKIPHNQFVTVYAGTGLLGLALFLVAFFCPVFFRHNYREPLFFSLNVMVFFSFMVESTIETAQGTAYYLFILLFCMNHLRTRTFGSRTVPGI